MWRKENSPTLLMGKSKSVQALQRIVWRFLKKQKIKLPYDPPTPLLGIYLEKVKTLIQKDMLTPMLMEKAMAPHSSTRAWKIHGGGAR